MLLEHLLISKVRIKILQLYFLNLGESYHVRAVVRKVGEEINAVRRELKNMEELGLLKSVKEGNKVVYSLNKNCALYQDCLSMVYKEFGLGRHFLLNKKAIGNVKYAMITKAFSKGIPIEPQNVDFLVVGDLNMQALSKAIKEAERELGREIHYTVMTEQEFSYRKSKRDSFLLNILAGSRIMLVGDEDEMLSEES